MLIFLFLLLVLAVIQGVALGIMAIIWIAGPALLVVLMLILEELLADPKEKGDEKMYDTSRRHGNLAFVFLGAALLFYFYAVLRSNYYDPNTGRYSGDTTNLHKMYLQTVMTGWVVVVLSLGLWVSRTYTHYRYYRHRKKRQEVA